MFIYLKILHRFLKIFKEGLDNRLNKLFVGGLPVTLY